MTTRRPPGRPRTVASRRIGRPLYMTPEEWATVDAAAGDEPRSEFIRRIVLEYIAADPTRRPALGAALTPKDDR